MGESQGRGPSLEADLQSLLNRGERLAFLVGAGVSFDAPSKVPGAKLLLASVLQHVATDNTTREHLLSFCSAERRDRVCGGDFLRLERVLQIVRDTVDPGLQLLDCLEEVVEPNANHILLAHALEQGHYVFTTNLDSLIERAGHHLGFETPARITEGEFSIDLATERALPLLKLHGSIRRFDGHSWSDSKASVMATLDAIGRGWAPEAGGSDRWQILKEVLQDHELVVIGYSGYDDFDVGPMLSRIRSTKRIHWINHIAEETAFRRYCWLELEQAMDDRNSSLVDHLSTFWLKHDQHLHWMGYEEAREPHDILVYDHDTSRVMDALSRSLSIASLAPSNSEPSPLHSGCSVKRSPVDIWAAEVLDSDWARPLVCGSLLASLGREGAIRHLESARQLALASGDKSAIALSSRELARIYQRKYDWDRARPLLRQCHDIDLELRNERGLLNDLLMLGNDEAAVGDDIDKALRNQSRALQLARQLRDESEEAACLICMGLTYQCRGLNELAAKHFEESLTASHRSGALRETAAATFQLALHNFHLGKVEDAQDLFTRSLVLALKLGENHLMAVGMHYLAETYERMWDIDEALYFYRRSIEVALAIGDKETAILSRERGMRIRRMQSGDARA